MVEKHLTLCALPFIHLATHPNGLVSPCCVANFENGISFSRSNGKLLRLGKDSINDIFNSDSFAEIRKKMLNNEQPIECIGCYNIEKNGLKSKRTEENEKFLSKFVPSDILPNTQFKFIELRLGNVCNSKCLTCNPMSSSKWIEDVKKFSQDIDKDHYNYEEYISDWYQNKNWYDELLSHSNELEEIYINGGEPTLIKEHFYFLEKLIQIDKAKDIKLIYNINCTNLPKKFIELLRQFKYVKLQLSIDDLYDRNFYIRYPSKWESVFKNYSILKNERFDISITQTISIFNICNVKNFSEFFQSDNIEYNFLQYPKFLHISNLCPELKELANQQITYLSPSYVNRFHYELNNIEFNSELFKKSINFVIMMDKIRGLDIKQYLKEYEYCDMYKWST